MSTYLVSTGVIMMKNHVLNKRIYELNILIEDDVNATVYGRNQLNFNYIPSGLINDCRKEKVKIQSLCNSSKGFQLDELKKGETNNLYDRYSLVDEPSTFDLKFKLFFKILLALFIMNLLI